MENRSKKSGGTKIHKKKGSLDLKSIYKSKVSEEGESMEKDSKENDQENVKKNQKRKSGKEVSLSSFESDAKKSRKEDGNDVKSELGFRKKSSGGSKGLHGVSLDSAGNGNTFDFPKHPRGLVGRKNLEIDWIDEPLGLSNSSHNSVDCAGTFNDGVVKCEKEAGPSVQLVRPVSHYAGNQGASNLKSAGKVSGSNSKIKQKEDLKSSGKGSSSNAKLKRKAAAHVVKESRKSRTSAQHVEEQNSVAVNNSDMSSKKQRNNSRKKKDLVVGKDDSAAVDRYDLSSKKQWSNSRKKKDLIVGEENSVAINNGDTSSKKQRINGRKKKGLGVGRDGVGASKKKSEPSLVSSVLDTLLVDFDEDDEDEEKLEQNAARMLSSRFDPSCTGFSSKRNSSVSLAVNECSIPVSSSRNSFSQKANSSSGGDSTSANDKTRALEPRTEDKGKGAPKKRRHFYEIPPRDLDPLWVLHRRIKVFWPLDESWYYGFVNDYHPEWRLHHIKYDDREDDWTDLHDEKFQILCFASEIPGKVKSKRVSPRKSDTHKEEAVLPENGDSCMGKSLDSEPTDLWLVRSSQHGKSSAKSLKTPGTSPVATSLLSAKTDNKLNNLAEPKRTGSNPDFESTSGDNLAVCGIVRKFVMGDLNGSRMVYVRKKYHKKGEGRDSMSRDIEAYRSTSGTVTPLAPTVSLATTVEDNLYEYVDSDKQLWSIDHQGQLRLNVMLVESREFRFQICLPVLPFSGVSLGTGYFWLFRKILMLKHGVVLPTSPAVILEILIIDSYLGLRFFLFEGCMKKALAFVFLILIASSQPVEHVNVDMQSPVTSIRLRLSSAQDLRKHCMFQFHSFSRLQSSKWVRLDSELRQHCLLIKQLQVSECTYDNIKELESGSSKQCKPNAVMEIPSFMGILPLGFSEEACKRTRQSALSLAANRGKSPHFALSFSAAPTFFLTLHLQLLMETNSAWGNHSHYDALSLPESEHGGECVQLEPSLVAVQDIAEHEIRKLEAEAPAFTGLTSSDEYLMPDVVEKVGSSENLHRENPNNAGKAGFFKDCKELTPEAVSPSVQCETKLLEEGIVSFPCAFTPATSPTFNSSSSSRLDGMIVDIPSCDQVDMSLYGRGCISRQPFQSPNPTSSRRSRKDGRSRISSPSGDLSPIWPDRSPKFMHGGFSNGPKKRRTPVQYTLPGSGYDFMPKQNMQYQRALPCKRIRRASLKGIYNGSRSNQKDFDSLACVANVLVTHGDKGWREHGAFIVLEVADDNEWRLTIKLSGVTKYSLKVKHVLQPGTNNRYSHAMLWKGGKDWVLEFSDKSQWTLFKEMHEECYNRNIRAASLKNIAIPGVRLVEESDDYGTEISFVRNSKKYFRQVQTDVEMAMNPSHILYDMDSDDERWLMAKKNSSDGTRCEEITEEFLEKTMNMFEKVAYVKHQVNFTDAEIQKLVTGTGSAEAATVIYQHWREKRGRKGMPLIRHLQPPRWERYEQQLKEWEHTVARGNSGVSGGIQEKVSTPEKPPMFAFCQKPRALDFCNRDSKQRTHRKFPVSRQPHVATRDHGRSLVFGRRSNGHSTGDENSTWYKNKPKKLGVHPSSNNQQMISYNQTTIGNRNEVADLSNQRHYHFEEPWKQGVEQLNGSDLHQLRLHDASAAAEHARKIGKLKREKAEEKFCTAEAAKHRAAAFVMNAEAIAAAHENSNGGN